MDLFSIKKTHVVSAFLDTVMGNRKSSSNVVGVSSTKSRRIHQSESSNGKASDSNIQQTKWFLSEFKNYDTEFRYLTRSIHGY